MKKEKVVPHSSIYTNAREGLSHTKGGCYLDMSRTFNVKCRFFHSTVIS